MNMGASGKRLGRIGERVAQHLLDVALVGEWVVQRRQVKQRAARNQQAARPGQRVVQVWELLGQLARVEEVEDAVRHGAHDENRDHEQERLDEQDRHCEPDNVQRLAHLADRHVRRDRFVDVTDKTRSEI